MKRQDFKSGACCYRYKNQNTKRRVGINTTGVSGCSRHYTKYNITLWNRTKWNGTIAVLCYIKSVIYFYVLLINRCYWLHWRLLHSIQLFETKRKRQESCNKYDKGSYWRDVRSSWIKICIIIKMHAFCCMNQWNCYISVADKSIKLWYNSISQEKTRHILTIK